MSASEGMPRTPPYRLETERLTIRCWQPADARALDEAIRSSLDHLLPWMPWAHDEPRSVSERVELLRQFHGRFDLGHDFVYGIFAPDESSVLGGTGLHTRLGDDAFEIGYWIRASRLREGLATEAVAALTRAAFALCEVERLEIHVEPDNTASAAIPRRLGYLEEGTLRRRLPALTPRGPRRDALIFSLFVEEFGASPAARSRVNAYDAAGNCLLETLRRE